MVGSPSGNRPPYSGNGGAGAPPQTRRKVAPAPRRNLVGAGTFSETDRGRLPGITHPQAHHPGWHRPHAAHRSPPSRNGTDPTRRRQKAGRSPAGPEESSTEIRTRHRRQYRRELCDECGAVDQASAFPTPRFPRPRRSTASPHVSPRPRATPGQRCPRRRALNRPRRKHSTVRSHREVAATPSTSARVSPGLGRSFEPWNCR